MSPHSFELSLLLIRVVITTGLNHRFGCLAILLLLVLRLGVLGQHRLVLGVVPVGLGGDRILLWALYQGLLVAVLLINEWLVEIVFGIVTVHPVSSFHAEADQDDDDD